MTTATDDNSLDLPDYNWLVDNRAVGAGGPPPPPCGRSPSPRSAGEDEEARRVRSSVPAPFHGAEGKVRVTARKGKYERASFSSFPAKRGAAGHGDRAKRGGGGGATCEDRRICVNP
jgi:hypothetical protein